MGANIDCDATVQTIVNAGKQILAGIALLDGATLDAVRGGCLAASDIEHARGLLASLSAVRIDVIRMVDIAEGD